MSELPSSEGPVQVKPQSNIYTLLMIVSILALTVTIVLVIRNLMLPASEGGYGIADFADIFKPFEIPKK